MTVQEEIEVKYILARSELLRAIDLLQCRCQRMSQSYFSPEKIKGTLLPVLQRVLNDPDLPLNFGYQNGRVRMVLEDGSASYYITVKGPRTDFYSRTEIQASVSAELYEELLREADEGSVSKSRYGFDGFLFVPDRKVPVTAEIDLLESAAGKNISEIGAPAFALVEVEVEAHEHVEHLKAGRHTFSFLSGAHEIGKLPFNLQRMLRMRYFAQAGIDAALENALRRLFPE